MKMKMNKRIEKKIILGGVFLFLGLMGDSFAGSDMMIKNFFPFHFNPCFFSNKLVSLSIGSTWVQGGQSETLRLTSDVLKKYVYADSIKTLTAASLFLGTQNPLKENVLTQLGLDLTVLNTVDMRGDIWDDADSTFNNYRFTYKIQHSHINFKAKLLLDPKRIVMPWVSASAGLGFNRALNFSNAAHVPETIPSPNFTSRMTTTFNYALGVGVQRPLDANWQIGLGYEFANWGKSSLGTAPGQTSDQGPSLSHLYSHTLLCNVTYFV